MVNPDLLKNSAYLERFSKGQPIAQAGTVRKMYLVASGSVGVYDADSGGKMGELAAGSLFAEQFFFTGEGSQAFRAQEDTTVFAIATDTFDDVARDCPAVLFELLRDAYAGRKGPAMRPAPPAMQMEPPAAPVETGVQGKGPAQQNAQEASPAARLRAAMFPASGQRPAPGAGEPARAEAQPPAPAQPGGSVLFPEGFTPHPDVRRPEYGKALFEKEYKCPYCGKTLKGYKVFLSKLVPSAPTRYDLRKYYKDFQMEWYDVITCPHCYFSALSEYFIEPSRLFKEKVQDRLDAAKNETVLDFTGERTLDFVFAAHYLALLCAPAYSSKQNQIDLRLWSNLSWLYEDTGETELELAAAAQAAKTGEALYMGGNLNKLQEQVVCLQVAGMLYRTGERENMTRWLFHAKTAKTGKRVYANLAEDLWEIVRAEKK